MHVLVVGAGIIGCAIAYELVEHGCTVDVLDARVPGRGATHASAGVLAPYIEGHRAPALRTLGARSLALFDRLVERLHADGESDFLYEREGTLEVAQTEDEALALQRSHDRLTSEGIEAHWLQPDDARAAEPALGAEVTGALLVSQQGVCGAVGLAQALRRASTRRGARFIADTQAIAIHQRGAGVVVETADGGRPADRAVLAAGSWSSQVSIGTAGDLPRVKPVRGQLLQLALPSRALTRVVWGTHCYLVPWPDGRVLVGATVEDVGYDERPTAGGMRELLDAAVQLMPALADATFEEVRVGLRPACGDELPVIGRSRTVPAVTVATGHYRNGILLTPMTMALVRDVMLGAGDDPALALVSPDRF